MLIKNLLRNPILPLHTIANFKKQELINPNDNDEIELRHLCHRITKFLQFPAH